MSALSRRRFLGGAAGCCAGAGLRRLPSAALADAFAATVLDPAAAARLGRRFLASRPALSRDARALGRMILASASQRRAFLAAAPVRRRRMLRERIAADFAAGRTVELDGWILAETETLVAAVLAVR